MSYLIGQIIACLVIAALLGVIIGWWLKRIGCKRETAKLEQERKTAWTERDRFKSDLTSLRTEYDSFAPKLKTSEDNYARLTAEFDDERSRFAAERERFSTSNAELSTLSAKLDSSQALVTKLRGELTAARDEAKKTVVSTPVPAVQAAVASPPTGKQAVDLLKAKAEIRKLNTEIDTLRKAEREGTAVNAELNRAKTEIAALKQKAAASAEGSAELSKARAEIAELQAKLTASSESAADLSKAQAEISELRTKLTANAGSSADLDKAQAEINSLKSQLSASASSDNEALAKARAQVTELQALLDGCKKRRGELESRVAELEAKLAAAPKVEAKPSWLMTAAPAAGADDLKIISGVGPKLEKMLNDLGIYTFSQVAGLDADGIAWVDENLEGFNGRVERDDWVGQAKKLFADKEKKDS